MLSQNLEIDEFITNIIAHPINVCIIFLKNIETSTYFLISLHLYKQCGYPFRQAF